MPSLTQLDPTSAKTEFFQMLQVDTPESVDPVLAAHVISYLTHDDLVECLFTVATMGNVTLMHALRELLNMLTHDQWQLHLQRSNTPQMTTASVIAIRDVLGFDNQGLALTVPLSSIDQLHEANYRFADESLLVLNQSDMFALKKVNPGVTVVCLNINNGAVMDLLEASGDSAIKDLLWNSPGSTVLDESIRLHRICQTLNLWASVLPKPKSLGHALDEMSYRTAEDSAGMALSAYLLNEGIEACSNAASLARHWVTITQTFPAEQVMPYLPKMPAQAKGKFLESELGL